MVSIVVIITFRGLSMLTNLCIVAFSSLCWKAHKNYSYSYTSFYFYFLASCAYIEFKKAVTNL